MSRQQTWMYFLLTACFLSPLSGMEPSGEYPLSRSILRRSPTVQIPRGNVDIVSAALAGADRKHDLAANTKVGSRWSGRPAAESTPSDANAPLIEMPPQAAAGPTAGNALPGEEKAASGATFLERWRLRRAEARAKAETKKEEKANLAAKKSGSEDGPLLAPPEVSIPGVEIPTAAEPATASARRGIGKK